MSNPRRRSAARHHATSSIAGLFIAVAFVASACSGGAVAEQDYAAVTEAELLADGTNAEVVACVVHVGRTALERGLLSEAATDELLTNCEAAQDVIGDDSEPTDAEADRAITELAMTAAIWRYGDDPVLDQLWDQCEAGSGAACDALFDAAPIGSDYEDFGVSCGDRADLLDCEELDLAPEEFG